MGRLDGFAMGLAFGAMLGAAVAAYVERPLPGREWNSDLRSMFEQRVDAYRDSILATPEPRP